MVLTLLCHAVPPLLHAGMNISVQLFAVKWKMIISAMVVLIAGKLAVMLAAGQMFGLSRMAALRAGEYASTQH